VLPSTVFLFGVAISSAFAGAALLEAHDLTVERMGGDKHCGTMPKEYYHVLLLAFRRCIANTLEIVYICTMICLNIGSQVEACQICDWLFRAMFDQACGLQIIGPSPGWICKRGDIEHDISIWDYSLMVSPGLLTVMAICIPLSIFNIRETMWFQYLSFAMACVCPIIWVAHLGALELDVSRLPVVGGNIEHLLGVVYINFNYAITLPSWSNERNLNVNANKVLYTAATFVTVLYVLLGLVGGAAVGHLNGDVITTKLQSRYGLTSFVSFTIFGFGATQLISQIPIFSLIARKNLVTAGWMGRPLATAVSVGIPWAITVMFYTGNALEDILNWIGMLVIPICNFFVPFVALAILRCPGNCCYSWISNPEQGASTEYIKVIPPEAYCPPQGYGGGPPQGYGGGPPQGYGGGLCHMEEREMEELGKPMGSHKGSVCSSIDSHHSHCSKGSEGKGFNPAAAGSAGSDALEELPFKDDALGLEEVEHHALFWAPNASAEKVFCISTGFFVGFVSLTVAMLAVVIAY